MLRMGISRLFRIIVIFIGMSTCISQKCQDNFINTGFEVKQRLPQQVFLVFEHIGLQQCSRECLLRTNCKAVAYNLENMNCYLGDNDTYITTSSNQEEVASTRTRLMHFETQLLKSCAGHSCDLSSLCVELSNGNSKCLPWLETNCSYIQTTVTKECKLDTTRVTSTQTSLSTTGLTTKLTTTQGRNPVECGNPPTVIGATTPNTPDRSVGTVLTYSCQSGRVTKGKPDTWCQTDGQWSAMSLLCTVCDTNYFVFDERVNFCYRIEDSQRNNYENAILHCNSMGGKLAKVDTSEKIATLVTNLNVQVYVDGTDEEVDGTWVYSDGTMVNIDLFTTGAPSLGDTNCLSLRSDLGKTLDIQCTKEKFSVCEQL